MTNLLPERRAEVWNTRVPDPRIAELETQLAEARAWNSTLADSADALRAELQGARKTLAASGIGGIYDVFQGVADAIEQMALYIKERDRHVTELEEKIVRLRLLANANVRVAAQTLGRPITRVEALAISHATLENAEAERIASDDAVVSIEEENARLKDELADSKETLALFMRCMQRANRLWREAHPDAPPCIPDGADAVVWLKEQVDALAERRGETCKTCYWSIVFTAHEPDGNGSKTYALCFHPDASIPRIRFALEHSCEHWYSKEAVDD